MAEKNLDLALDNPTFLNVRSVIVSTIACDMEEVVPEATLSDDLGADSLDAVEINMALEDALGISIPDTALTEMRTVADIVSYIESHK